jgi:hypothetical protein
MGPSASWPRALATSPRLSRKRHEPQSMNGGARVCRVAGRSKSATPLMDLSENDGPWAASDAELASRMTACAGYASRTMTFRPAIAERKGVITRRALSVRDFETFRQKVLSGRAEAAVGVFLHRPTRDTCGAPPLVTSCGNSRQTRNAKAWWPRRLASTCGASHFPPIVATSGCGSGNTRYCSFKQHRTDILCAGTQHIGTGNTGLSVPPSTMTRQVVRYDRHEQRLGSPQ